MYNDLDKRGDILNVYVNMLVMKVIKRYWLIGCLSWKVKNCKITK